MGIFFAVFGIIILIGISPALIDLTQDLKTNSTFNCADSSDYDSNNPDTNTFGCTISDLAVPLLILGVIIASIIIVLYGRKEEQPMQQYQGY